MNVIDIDEFNESDWRIDDKEECEPTFSGQTVTYTNLLVGNCSSTSEERDNDIIYVFKIRVLPTGSDPIQAVDHMFDASCLYVNNDTVTASFIPLTQRRDNATGKISWGAGMAQWRERSPSTSVAHVRFWPCAICRLNLLLVLAMLPGFSSVFSLTMRQNKQKGIRKAYIVSLLWFGNTGKNNMSKF